MKKYEKNTISEHINQAIPKKLLEFNQEDLNKLKNISEVFLGLAAVGGIVTLSVLAPNMLKLLPKLRWAKKTFKSIFSDAKTQKQKIVKGIYYAKEQGYVKLLPKGNDIVVKITAKGRKKIRQMNFSNLKIPKSNWDGCWWFVLADIPTEGYKTMADQFRKKLKSMNFFPLQKTVWVYPYDPRDEIDFVSGYYQISRYVTVLRANILDSQDEKVIKKYFKNLQLI